MKLNTVHSGDCLEVMKDIPTGSVDMILADLPYQITDAKWDIVIPFEPLWEQYERIVKPNGVMVLTASQPFTSALVMSNPDLFKHEWIWEKHKGTNIFQVKTAPMKKHESILVFSKGKHVYNPQMTKGKPYKLRSSEHKMGADYVHGNGKERNVKYADDIDTTKRYPTTIQKFTNHFQKERRHHPTQKPVALFEYLIQTYTNESDTVLDNVIGSGTTAIACMNTNRNFIGIEKEKEYVDIANKRIKEHKQQMNLF